MGFLPLLVEPAAESLRDAGDSGLLVFFVSGWGCLPVPFVI